jgi:phospholipase C
MVIDPLPLEEAREALRERVDHIVVLMMENRSFDQMLGYLSLEGRSEVEGLRRGMSNPFGGRDWDIHNLEKTWFQGGEDPNHSGDWVARQINDGAMDGFVRSYIETRKDREAAKKAAESPVMGYLTGRQLPVYDYLAEEFCVCDHWFASVAGATWPNRLYAAAGDSGGRKSNQRLFGRIDWPFYSLPSFVRHLDESPHSWRWYSAEPLDTSPPTIQLVDEQYRGEHGKNFALFERREAASRQPSFLDDAAAGELANVSWIDPNFHLSFRGVGAKGVQNDDHPPADVVEGQRLVARVVNALIQGRSWERTLLIVTYDEHGGMFDHVAPPTCDDDRPAFRRLGVRVPALVVSPWVPRGSVAKDIFDHTSIIRTVLERFRREGIPDMGRRVGDARHLGSLLTLDAPRTTVPPAPDVPEEIGAEFGLAPSDEEALRETEALRDVPGQHVLSVVPPTDEAAANDLQQGLAAAVGELKGRR